MTGNGAASGPAVERAALVVENEEDMRAMLCALFRTRGVEAVCVEGCAAALEVLKVRAFRVAVLDLGMSPIDGQTCARYISALYPEMKLLAYTAYEEATYPREVLRKNGFARCFLKGGDGLDLADEVTRLAGVQA